MDRLEKERNENRRLVKNKQELDKLWERLTKNTRELESKADKRHGKPIHMRELDDGMIIQYKEASKSGGEAIEIHNKNPYINKTIHIK